MKRIFLGFILLIITMLFFYNCEGLMDSIRTPEEKARRDKRMTKEEFDTKLAELKATGNSEAIQQLIDRETKNDLNVLAENENVWADYPQVLNEYAYYNAGIVLFDLKAYDYFYKELVHRGMDTDQTKRPGFLLLEKIGDSHIPITLDWLKNTLDKGDTDWDNMVYTLNNILPYLWKKKLFEDNVELLARLIDEANFPMAHLSNLLNTIIKVNHIEAEPRIRKLLKSQNEDARYKACWALGGLKQQASLPALEEVAKNDPAYKLDKNDNKIYYIRNEAQKMIDLIKKAE